MVRQNYWEKRLDEKSTFHIYFIIQERQKVEDHSSTYEFSLLVSGLVF